MGIELDTSRIEDGEITDCTNPSPQKQVKTDSEYCVSKYCVIFFDIRKLTR